MFQIKQLQECQLHFIGSVRGNMKEETTTALIHACELFIQMHHSLISFECYLLKQCISQYSYQEIPRSACKRLTN